MAVVREAEAEEYGGVGEAVVGAGSAGGLVVGETVGYVQPGAVHEETFGRIVVEVAAGAGTGVEHAESFGGLELVVVVASDAISVLLEGPASPGPAQSISSQLVSQQTFGARVLLPCASVVDNSVRNTPSIAV